MDALVLMHTSDEAAEIAAGLRAKGHKVTLCGDVGRAMVLSCTQHFDLLVANLMLDDEPTLSVAMSMQYHNPALATIVLTNSLLFSHGELFSMLTSLRCVMSDPFEVSDLLEIAAYCLDDAGRDEAQQSVHVVVPASGPNNSDAPAKPSGNRDVVAQPKHVEKSGAS